MAHFIDNWVWEPMDEQILACARDGRRFPSSTSYRWQAEALQEQGFINIEGIENNCMLATLTDKGRETAKKVLCGA